MRVDGNRQEGVRVQYVRVDGNWQEGVRVTALQLQFTQTDVIQLFIMCIVGMLNVSRHGVPVGTRLLSKLRFEQFRR